MKTIIGKITIDILTSIYQPFWFAILLSIMTMFFYLYVKCPEGAGKGWKAAIRTWIDHFKYDQTQPPLSKIGTTNCTKTITKTDLLLKILLTPEGKCK